MRYLIGMMVKDKQDSAIKKIDENNYEGTAADVVVQQKGTHMAQL